MSFDHKTMRDAYAEVERIKAKADSLYFKMEETDPPEGYENDPRWRRYMNAKGRIDDATGCLLEAMDSLRMGITP